MEHSKEPWKSGKYLVYVGGDAVVASASNAANAKRISVCVNALAGFTTEEIEAGIDLVALKQQRNELVAALLEISQVACSLSPEQKIANAAIAKVKS